MSYAGWSARKLARADDAQQKGEPRKICLARRRLDHPEPFEFRRDPAIGLSEGDAFAHNQPGGFLGRVDRGVELDALGTEAHRIEGGGQDIECLRARGAHRAQSPPLPDPGVRRFMDDTRREARESGFVETVYGRRLYLPDIRSGNEQVSNAVRERMTSAAELRVDLGTGANWDEAH